MTYSSIEQVIATAKLMLRIESSSDADYFLTLQIYHAINTIGAYNSFIKCRESIDIVDNEACLPDNYFKLLGLRFIPKSDDLNNATNPIFCGGIYVDQTFLYQQGCNDGLPEFNTYYTGSYQIVGNKIVLNGKTSAQKVLIAYLGYYIDQNGEPVIEQGTELALASYAAYMYSLSFPEAYNPMQISQWNKIWIAQANMVKGRAISKDFRNNKAELMAIVNSLVPAKTYFPL